jgi:hypothetical protein
VEDLRPRLSARLAKCFDAANGDGSTSGTLQFRPGEPAISCSFESLELAGGHKGLIVSEAAVQQEPAHVFRLPIPAKKQPAAVERLQMSGRQAAPAGWLTPEEMRAFKAIGRTVRRLAKEKRRSACAKPELAPLPALPQASVCPQVRTAPPPLFSAFDLVLYLNGEFVIERTDGRPQHIGWRKSGLIGQPAVKFLLPAEQTIFRRMVKKLGVSAKICRDTLQFSGEAGGTVPCRAILGRLADADEQYFLALLSLELPSRLKRQPAQAQFTRLAA